MGDKQPIKAINKKSFFIVLNVYSVKQKYVFYHKHPHTALFLIFFKLSTILFGVKHFTKTKSNVFQQKKQVDYLLNPKNMITFAIQFA